MTIKNKRILITGAAGFIGSNLVDKLIENNCVIAVDNFNDFYDLKIKESNISQHLNNPNFKLYKTDICYFDGLKKIFAENKIDLIVHLAARAGVRPSLENPLAYIETNINGTVNLLELTKVFGINKFIFASSSSVYGALSVNSPSFSEEMRIDKSISPYAATKAAGEILCHTFSNLYGINIFCLRFFTVYGPRQRPDLAIHKFAKLISHNKPIPMYGDGTTKRDYTYIDDIISGVLKAIEYEKTPFEIINLGGGNPVSLNRLIEILGKKFNQQIEIEKLPLQAGDVPFTSANIEKAKKLLNYYPSTNIEYGIEKFVQWFIKT